MINEALPEGWQIVKLGDVCETTSGGTPSRKQKEYYEGNIPWVKSGELNKGLILNTEEKVTAEAIKNSSAKVFPKGTLLIALYGATIGKLAFLGVDASTNQAICGIFKGEKVDLKYLYHFLFSKRRDLIKQGIGGAQPNISQAILKSLALPLPPHSEQHLIVEKIEELFSELDKSIENLKTAQQQLKVYRQAVLKWAFEGKLTNEEVQDGELPEGWEWVKLGTVCKTTSGGTPNRKKIDYYSGNIPWVKSGELNKGVILSTEEKITEDAVKNSSTKIFPKGTLLIALYGATIGKLAFLGIDAATNQAICGIFKNEIIDSQYLYYYLRFSKSKLIGQGIGGAQPNISQGILKDLEIPFATIQEQQKIVQEIESRLSVCDKMEETITTSLQQAEVLRQSILKKAFEGKLIKPQAKPVYKPKNVYFYQMQVLGKIAAASKEKGISHGEMTIAKYAYLVDKIYRIPTYYDYKRWHLGPYPPEIKKAINNSKFFSKNSNGIEVTDIETLNKYQNPYTDQLQSAIDDLSSIFLPYQSKNRSHQIELLATVCKVIEDIQSADLEVVRASMAEWKIDLPTTHFKSKAEKFSEEEIKKCLDMINEKGWIKKLIIQ